jgi:hypothetical protein
VRNALVLHFVLPLAFLELYCAGIHAYEELRAVTGGHIQGKIKFTGSAPLLRKIEISKDQEVCGRTEKTDEALLVGPDLGLGNVVVSILDIAKGKKFPDLNGVLDQKDCLYLPHIVLTPVGKPLTILNSDGVLHSVHTHSVRNPPFNRAQSKFKKEMQEIFLFPERIQLTCDVHGWMSGWIVVMEHPYFSVSALDGSFELQDIPEGGYDLSFWHEILGEKRLSVNVEVGRVSEVQLEW